MRERRKKYLEESRTKGGISGQSENFFILYNKAEQYALKKNLISDDYLKSQLVTVYPNRGASMAGSYTTENGIDSPTIFLAVGENIKLELVVFYFDPKGKAKITSTSWTVGEGRSVNINDSHPNPSNFPISSDPSPDDPKSYPYTFQGSATSGFALRHELQHDVLIAQRQRKGEIPDFSEYNADIKAMQTIRDAWEKWQESGYKDNSGYYFVFSLPKEKGGGYILTKQIAPKLKSPSGT